MRRTTARATQPGHTGTKARQVVQLLHEQAKRQRHIKSREKRQTEALRRYAQHREKQKKHRGH